VGFSIGQRSLGFASGPIRSLLARGSQPSTAPQGGGAAVRFRLALLVARTIYRGDNDKLGNAVVPVLFFILLVILIAQFGFWNTLSAILGAIGMMVLLIVLLVGLAGVAFSILTSRMRGRW
jgi:hypothetical protein